MIVVVGRVTSDAERREQLVRVGQAVARASRDEKGCLGYRLYADTESEHDYVFIEEWESLEALRAHFATPHVAEFMQAIFGVIAGPPDVKFHEVAKTMTLEEASAS